MPFLTPCLCDRHISLAGEASHFHRVILQRHFVMEKANDSRFV
ncbi:hypothetical protein BN134_3167 [Cronobacter dublinensis 1210]|uniref:Uncharacterized protein n=1 Tax=Cronobacter dublinensis 1210 TaxID=1208656 RepID=A0ABP1WDP4_9ENTR|nr:hypothetical protein BN134_3167 [Cronobacter dublinensis 1210]